MTKVKFRLGISEEREVFRGVFRDIVDYSTIVTGKYIRNSLSNYEGDKKTVYDEKKSTTIKCIIPKHIITDTTKKIVSVKIDGIAWEVTYIDKTYLPSVTITTGGVFNEES